jgi:hypothetical protein
VLFALIVVLFAYSGIICLQYHYIIDYRDNIIASLVQMPEEEAFCVLVKLMRDYKLRELFKPTMADLGLCFYQLEKLVEVSVLILLHIVYMYRYARSYASFIPSLPEF